MSSCMVVHNCGAALYGTVLQRSRSQGVDGPDQMYMRPLGQRMAVTVGIQPGNCLGPRWIVRAMSRGSDAAATGATHVTKQAFTPNVVSSKLVSAQQTAGA